MLAKLTRIAKKNQPYFVSIVSFANIVVVS